MLQRGDEPIPGYRLEKFLGRGQFGEVWRATSPGRASVALKFLNLSERQGWKEFRAIQQIKSIRTHPHLAPITALWLLDENGEVLGDDVVDSYGGAEDASAARATLVPGAGRSDEQRTPQRLVVATLLCDKSLQKRLEECRAEGLPGIPLEELLRYMEEAAKGIDFLNAPHHDLGSGPVAVQHCDIKPDNIMLAGGSVMICDYGVSRVFSDARTAATGTSMGGSPAYMAPESIDRKPSASSDQYSLAISYVELRTGELPFTTDSYIGVLEAHKTGKLDLSRLDPAEREVIRKATSLDPAERFPSCVAMVRALRRSVEKADAPEPAPGPRRLVVVAAAVALVGVISAAVLFGRFSNRSQQSSNGGSVQDLITASLRIVPPDATVMVDGEEIAIAAGTLLLSKPAGAVIDILVRRPPEYAEYHQSVAIDELQKQQWIRLERDPEHTPARIAQRAYAQLEGVPVSADRLASAVSEYAKAMQLEAQAYGVAPAVQAMVGEEDIDHFAEDAMALDRHKRWLVFRNKSNSLMLVDLTDRALRPQFVHRREPETSVILDLAVCWPYFASSGLDEPVQVSKAADDGSLQSSISPEALRGLAIDMAAVGQTGDAATAAGPTVWLVAGSISGEAHACLLSPEGVGQPQRLDTQGALEITDIAITPKGRIVAGTSDGALLLYSINGQRVSEPVAPMDAATGSEIQCLVVSDDGRWAAYSSESPKVGDTGDEYAVYLVDLERDAVYELPGAPTHHVESLAFDQAARRLAGGTSDGGIQVWEGLDQLASGGGSADQLRWHNVGSAPLTGATPTRINDLAFIGQLDDFLVSAGSDGSLCVWDLSYSTIGPMLLPGGQGEIIHVATTDDWIIAGCKSGPVLFWDLRRCLMVLRACAKAGIKPMPSSAGSGVDA